MLFKIYKGVVITHIIGYQILATTHDYNRFYNRYIDIYYEQNNNHNKPSNLIYNYVMYQPVFKNIMENFALGALYGIISPISYPCYIISLASIIIPEKWHQYNSDK